MEALLSGVAMHYAKPMLVAEVRRILPTAVGLPMELSFYTAAVAAASVECKFDWCNLTAANLRSMYTNTENVFSIVQATVTPPLPENFHAAQLLKSDINMRAAITPR